MNRNTSKKAFLRSDRWNEDLQWQAERAAKLGRRYCQCSGEYHMLWSSLRASGFLGSLNTEEDALRDALYPLSREAKRILIGGSADPATLCLFGRIFDSHELEVTIVDRCRAPLELIKEFAAAKSIICNTTQADLLTYKSDIKWNLIFLNYTLSFIAPSDRKRFFLSLGNALAPGGHLVCLAKTGNSASVEQRESLMSAWYEQAKNALRRSGLEKHFEGLALNDAIKSYAEERTKRRYNILSTDMIEELFVQSGLKISSVQATQRVWALEGENYRKADTESSVIIIGTK